MKTVNEKKKLFDKEKIQSFRKEKTMLFGIRNKIFVCFLVPIVFIIIVGLSAYEQAAQGMSSKFQESTQQTIKMAKEYLDVSNSFIKADGMKYAANENIRTYYMGKGKDDPVTYMKLVEGIQTDIETAQTGNPFISNIHLITESGVEMFSTYKDGKDGLYDAYKEEMFTDSKKYKSWVDSHPVLDEHLGLSQDDYILSYQLKYYSGNVMIVIDIGEAAIREFLQELDLGEGSIVGLVTPGGREIICENLEEGQESVLTEGEKVFYGQDFFDQISAMENGEEGMTGAAKINYLGQEYQFIYSKSEESGTVVCALVPEKTVTGQADDIRTFTIGMVVLASILAATIGIIIASGIQGNMKRISKKLLEVAKGDLTVKFKVKGKDEFRSLAASATAMIDNNRKLVRHVNEAADDLDKSAREMSGVSSIIDDYSANITKAINDINDGMERQSEHARECVERTGMLSEEMQEVSRVVSRVEALVGETEKMISQGMEIVRALGGRADETTQITACVGSSIEQLKGQSEVINEFVEVITSISKQTNLLSLNASIEAARAGEAGKGFAVVAEEIRQLADDSAKAAGNIRENVDAISKQTMDSVKNAKQAEEMVALQSEAVKEVIDVFREMNARMNQLFGGLKEIIESTEKADKERENTLSAVKNISEIIEETAENTEIVQNVAGKLMKNVENLNETADVLGKNMQVLKSEIDMFRTETIS